MGTALSDDPALLSEGHRTGSPPSTLAAFFGSPTVAVLIEGGAHVDAWTSNTFHNQPLHAAVAGRHPETRLTIARMLLDAPGRSRAPSSPTGAHPLMSAARTAMMLWWTCSLLPGPIRHTETKVAELRQITQREAGRVELAKKLTPT